MTSSVNAMSMPHYQRRAFVASRLKDARLNSGLTQRDVAAALHIGQSTYCRIENGKTEPSVVQLATLSGLYGLSVLWLLGMPSFIVNGVKNYFSSSSS
jgi:transcriptional regulator with XRE-family HTH domain